MIDKTWHLRGKSPAMVVSWPSARSGGLVLAALLLWAALAPGCSSMETAGRGTTVSFERLQRERAHLPEVCAGEIAAGRSAEAFYVLEFSKSRAFAGLSAGSGRGRTDSVPELYRNLDQNFASTEVAAVSGELTRGLAVARARQPSALGQLAAHDDSAFWQEQQEVALRIESIARRGLPYRLALAGRFVITTVEEIQRGLAGDLVLLSFQVSADAVHVFVVTRGDSRLVRLNETPEALRLQTAALIGALRLAKGDAWQGVARWLWQALLGPLGPEVARARAITFVPDGFLANVPFAVLESPTGQLLLEQARVSYLPSASFYNAIIQRPLLAAPPRMLAIGNALYPKPWQPLATAEAEARAVSRIFDDSSLLVGADATEQRFVDAYRNYNVLHFATHGQFAGAEAAAASSLLLTRGGGADGHLTAAEISRLDLSHCYLAVLSACETSMVGADDALGSITAAFLSAGAPTVIGSLWQVSDDSTAILMMRFYEHFLELGSAEALRSAQLAVRKQPRWQHPFFWAAFALYGMDK